MTAKDLNIGDKVKVAIEPGHLSWREVGKYDGKVMTITKRKSIRVRSTVYVYYELDKAVSDMGVPYCFDAKMLELVK